MPTDRRPRRTAVRRQAPALLVAAVVAAGCGTSGPDRATDDAGPPRPVPTATVSQAQEAPGPVISAQWSLAPGRLGPLRVGADAEALASLGLVVAADDPACDTVWRAAPELSATGTMLDFRAGSADDLDQVSVFREAVHAETWVTAEGAGIGSTTAELEAAYGDRLRSGSWPVEGGRLDGQTLFGAEGALTFQVEGDEVIALHLTPGSDPHAFVPPVLGC